MDKRNALILILITCLSGLLRFLYIGFQNAHTDETFVISFAAQNLGVFDIIVRSLTAEANPPLYFIVAHYSMILFNGIVSELVAIRIPSAIFGVLLIPASYFLAVKMYSGSNDKEKFGILVSATVCLMSNFVFYSDFGRAYSMVALTFCICCYYFVVLFKEGINKKDMFLFCTFGVISVYTHLYAAIPFALMMLFLLQKDNFGEWRKVVSASVVSGIFFLPLLSYIPYMMQHRNNAVAEYGYSIQDMIFVTPLELFSFAAPIIIPAIVLQVVCVRDKLQAAIVSTFLLTFSLGLILSSVTPIIPHYFILLAVPMVIVALEYLYDKLYGGYRYIAAVLILSILAANIQQVIMFFTIVRM